MTKQDEQIEAARKRLKNLIDEALITPIDLDNINYLAKTAAMVLDVATKSDCSRFDAVCEAVKAAAV